MPSKKYLLVNSMKNIIILLIAFMALSSFCCKKKKKAVANATTNTSQQKTTVNRLIADSSIWYKVSFISIGTGIDLEALKLCKKFIADYETKNRTTITYTEASWGREGEKDYCFLLNKSMEKEFQQQLEKVLIHSSLVRYKYNCKCDKYREIVPEQE
jgi:hypothetical protein